MARTPFTQSVIHDILEDTGVISMDLIMDRLPDWDEKEIKQRLSGWRYQKAPEWLLFNFLDKAIKENNLSDGIIHTTASTWTYLRSLIVKDLKERGLL